MKTNNVPNMKNPPAPPQKNPSVNWYSLTMSGRRMYFKEPSKESISLPDIFFPLSRMPRFTGQMIPDFYSVAEHSVFVAKIAVELFRREKLAIQLPERLEYERLVMMRRLFQYALLHDCHEAYTGDVSTPLKKSLGCGESSLLVIQRNIQKCIHDYFGLGEPSAEIKEYIRRADKVALVWELMNIMPPDNDGLPHAYPEVKHDLEFIESSNSFDLIPTPDRWDNTICFSPMNARTIFVGHLENSKLIMRNVKNENN